MSDPAEFKFDVRVRDRMLKRGLLVEADLKRHLDNLADAEDKSESVILGQPALGTAGDRHGEAGRQIIGDDEREAS